MIKMTMEALWYKAYGDPDQFWWNQYLKAVKKVGGENNVNWGATVLIPEPGELQRITNKLIGGQCETWRDRSQLF